MAVTYGFYDSLGGDRKYNADQLSRMFEGIITEGVFQSVGGALIVSAGTGMTVNVAAGRAWFRNTWTLNDSVLPIALDASEPALNRIDRIVLEVNKDLGVRANSIKSVKGTPASSPVAPTLVDTATVKQYALADIYVGLGVTSITGANITNKVGTTGTPFITGVVSSIDVATLMAQYEAQFNEWFADLQNELDANQAANLQSQITALETENDYGWMSVSGTWSYSDSKTVVVPSDATTKYKKGWGVRLKQGGSYKYYYIYSVSATSMSLRAGTSYTIANAPITDIWVTQRPAEAMGFPTYFSWTTTIEGESGSAGTYAETTHFDRFSISGGLVHLSVSKIITNKGSWSGRVRIKLPIPGAPIYSPDPLMGVLGLYGGGSPGLSPKAMLRIDSDVNANTFLLKSGPAFVNWTDIVLNDYLIINASYMY